MSLDHLVTFLEMAKKNMLEKVERLPELPNSRREIIVEFKVKSKGRKIKLGEVSTCLVPLEGSTEHWMGVGLECKLPKYQEFVNKLRSEEIAPPEGWEKWGISFMSEGICLVFDAEDNNLARITYSQKEGFTKKSYEGHLAKIFNKTIALFQYGKNLAEQAAPVAVVLDDNDVPADATVDEAEPATYREIEPPKPSVKPEKTHLSIDDLMGMLSSEDAVKSNLYRQRMDIMVSKYGGNIGVADYMKGKKIMLEVENVKKVFIESILLEEPFQDSRYTVRYAGDALLIIRKFGEMPIDEMPKPNEVKETIDYANKLLERIEAL